MSGKLNAGMRKITTFFSLAVMSAANLGAQQAPSTQDGPSSVAPPARYSDGSYVVGRGIVSPKIIHAVPGIYPDEPLPDGRKCCFLGVTVGADGLPSNVQVYSSHSAAFNAAAIKAVEESKFEAGRWNQQPVAVRINVWVRFSADLSPAIPTIAAIKYTGANGGPMADVPPRVLSAANAEYSEEARRKKIQGTVTVSMLVNEQGLPTDLRVLKSLGYGLDEKAMESVSRYRFKPALKDGKPMAVPVNIQVDFKLY